MAAAATLKGVISRYSILNVARHLPSTKNERGRSLELQLRSHLQWPYDSNWDDHDNKLGKSIDNGDANPLATLTPEVSNSTIWCQMPICLLCLGSRRLKHPR